MSQKLLALGEALPLLSSYPALLFSSLYMTMLWIERRDQFEEP